jgi:large subunit ribosomal protein L22
MPDTATATRETAARLRHAPVSPPKVRQVLELIRGQDVETARDTLRFCERSAAREVGKLLDSAIANAEHNNQIPEDELFVTRAHADEGPTLKRWRPRARGRGVRIRKRTSHVTIVLARFEDNEMQRRRGLDAQTGRGRRRAERRRPAEQPVPEPDLEAAAPDDADDETAADTGPEATPAKKATAKKATTKKATTKKATTKKATTKKATTKKATTKKATGASTKKTTRKAPAKRPGRPKKDED